MHMSLPTIEEVRAAAQHINEFMAHWDERLKRAANRPISLPTPYNGLKVKTLRYIYARPERDVTANLWLAEFNNPSFAVSELLFQIDTKGNISFADDELFLSDEIYGKGK